ncbi:unnamed protein product [Orchesella dallaii]|uniref:Uncharacterized protein n=1 Tax=Orchesella dallaii TaxID=48710 RepID=A0ABP1RTJ2_9HEXA
MSIYPPMDAPLMIQYTKLGITPIKNITDYRKRIKMQREVISVPVELDLPIDLKNINGYYECPISNLLFGWLENTTCRSICGELDLRKFVVKSRPWSCEASIDLFPDEKMLLRNRKTKHLNYTIEDLRSFSQTFNAHFLTSTQSRSGFLKIIPSYQPYNILVLYDASPKGNGKIENIQEIILAWMDNFLPNSYQSRKTELSRNKLFIQLASRTGDSTNKLKILSTHIVHIIKNGFKANITMSNCPGKLTSFTKGIQTFTQGTFLDMDHLRYQTKFADDEDNENPHKFCRYIHGNSIQVGFSVLDAYARLWTSLIENSTVIVGQRQFFKSFCEYATAKHEGRIHKDNIPTSSIISLGINHDFGDQTKYTPTRVETPGESLTFVSCGRPPRSALAFSELVSIFDSSSWCFIGIIFFVITPLALYYLERQHHRTMLRSVVVKDNDLHGTTTSLYDTVWQPVIVLLDQGDPFRIGQIKLPGMKLLMGALLIAGLVISNAYRHDNVYNMIAPRKLIPYWFFNELVRDNFEIFTRAHEHGENLNFRFGTVNITNISAHKFSYFGLYDVGFYRELIKEKVVSEVANVVNEIQNGKNREEGKNILSIIYNHSTLSIPMIKDARSEIRNMNTARFRAMEKEYLYKELEGCDRKAVILPLKNVYEYISKLKKGSKGNLYVGRETLGDKAIGFYLKGWVPELILRRVKGLSSSGVWEGLDRFYGYSYRRLSAYFEDEIVVVKPTMEGNIMVVFLVLMAGIGVGTVVLAAEGILKQIISIISNHSLRKRKELSITIQTIEVEPIQAYSDY